MRAKHWVLAGVCVALAGCSTKPSTGTLAPTTAGAPAGTAASSAPPSASPTTHSAAFKVGDRVETSAGNFVILHAYNPAVSPKGSGILTPPSPGVTLVAVDVEGCAGPNPEGGTADINPLYFTLKMADNTTADPDYFNTVTPSLESQTLPPNQCGRGWVTYDVPPGEHPASLVLSSGGNEVVTWSLTS